MNEGLIFALDVGGGTQDLFLWNPGQPVENAVKMVLPAPTQMVARKVSRVTAAQQALFLSGRVMGGGAVTQAIRRHLKMGLPVYATAAAALTLHDNPAVARGWGVQLTAVAPEDAVEVVLGDVDLEFWHRLFTFLEVPFPSHFAVAVQDHGFSPHLSNRVFRFQHWQKFLAGGGLLDELCYREPPDYLTRMRAVAESVPGVVLMDTGAAAVWGALLDARARPQREKGLMVVNVGNAHTLAALVQGERLWGIYEHHTGLLDRSKLFDQLRRFQAGTLSHEEVFADQGHGCAISPGYPPEEPFGFTVITGPRRQLAQGWPGAVFAAPFGDMMLTGAFGLAAALIKVCQLPITLTEPL